MEKYELSALVHEPELDYIVFLISLKNEPPLNTTDIVRAYVRRSSVADAANTNL